MDGELTGVRYSALTRRFAALHFLNIKVEEQRLFFQFSLRSYRTDITRRGQNKFFARRYTII